MITIGEEVLEAMNGLWKRCMIVKVIGRHISIAVLSRKLRELWKPRGAMYVMDLPRQFFMIRFEEEEEYLAALTGGQWRVFGNYLMVQDWSSKFDPLRDEIKTTPVWVRLSNIPVNFYHKAIMMGIARGLGKPLKVDLTTLNIERARFARICVEVNLSKPLKGTVVINGDRYYVAYEGLNNICSLCGIYGHLVHTCLRGEQVKKVMPTQRISREEILVSNPVDPEFTTVRRTGRKAGSSPNVVFSAGGSAEESTGGQIRKVMSVSEKDGVEITNRFQGLGEIAELEELREVEIVEGGDKENRDPQKDLRKSQVILQSPVTRGFSNLEKGKGANRNGPLSRRTGVLKPSESIGPKQKYVKSNKPMRGLVFGLIRGEELVSANGKRLRVETESMGRPGGAFPRNSEEMSGGVSLSLMAMPTPRGQDESEVQLDETAPMMVNRTDIEVGNTRE